MNKGSKSVKSIDNKIAATGKSRIAAKRSYAAGVGIAIMALSSSAHAEGLGEIFKRLTGLAADGVSLFQAAGVAGGVLLIVLALFGFVTDAKKDGNGPINKKVATVMLVVGILLCALSSVLETGSDTVWGDGKAKRSKIDIIQ